MISKGLSREWSWAQSMHILFFLLTFYILYCAHVYDTANILATGVRKYPAPIGWVAAMPVEDRADAGSFWSGYTKEQPHLKRPRRVDETIGNQAGEFVTNWFSSTSFLARSNE